MFQTRPLADMFQTQLANTQYFSKKTYQTQTQTLRRPIQNFRYCFGFAKIALSVRNARTTNQRKNLVSKSVGTVKLVALDANTQLVKTAGFSTHAPKKLSMNGTRLMDSGSVITKCAEKQEPLQ